MCLPISMCFSSSSIKVILDSFLSVKKSSNSNAWFLHNQPVFHDRPKFRKVQLYLLLCQYLNSKIHKALLRYDTACASVINVYHKLDIFENYRLKYQTRKWWFEFFRQGLNRKLLVICSINNFYTPLMENIALRLRLLYIIVIQIVHLVTWKNRYFSIDQHYKMCCIKICWEFWLRTEI